MHTCISRFSPAVISLSDTLGSASPELLEVAFGRLGVRGDQVEVGAHLHAHPAQAAAKVEAALRGGCRRFDAAMGGVGGCPFAADALVGNVPTEVLVQLLAGSGLWTPPDAGAWESAQRSARNVFS
jgi:hydroxymethylglutaryl-CoA lyase